MLSLTKDKVDRLSELGIDSAQVLACQNPFLIWPRLPYDLGLIVFAQFSQAYFLYQSIHLRFRNPIKYVIDIFDLHVRLADPTARDEVCRALELDVGAAQALVRQLDEDQSFNRLKEVRDALVPRAQQQTSCCCLRGDPAGGEIKARG